MTDIIYETAIGITDWELLLRNGGSCDGDYNGYVYVVLQAVPGIFRDSVGMVRVDFAFSARFSPGAAADFSKKNIFKVFQLVFLIEKLKAYILYSPICQSSAC